MCGIGASATIFLYVRSLRRRPYDIGINELEVKPITTITKCHIIDRIDKAIKGKEITPDILLKAIDNWEDKYGDIGKLQMKAIENKLPKMTTRQAISYLTSVIF